MARIVLGEQTVGTLMTMLRRPPTLRHRRLKLNPSDDQRRLVPWKMSPQKFFLDNRKKQLQRKPGGIMRATLIWRSDMQRRAVAARHHHSAVGLRRVPVRAKPKLALPVIPIANRVRVRRKRPSLIVFQVKMFYFEVFCANHLQ